MKKARLVLWILFVLVTCTPKDHGDPAKVTEKYLIAKVERDEETIRELLCSDLEAIWEKEIHTFDTVRGVHIEGMTCYKKGENNLVECQGKIIAEYGGEQKEFLLGTYKTIYETGEWRWCGEAR